MLSRHFLIKNLTGFRFFRTVQKNPYVDSEVKLTDAEASQQLTKPVWERLFDHR